MSRTVVRRFELHVAEPGMLDAVAREVKTAVQAQAPGQVADPEIKKVQRPPVLEVRLRGAAPTISSVMDRVRSGGSARIRRDRMEVPGDVSRGDVYPDSPSLLRIDPGREAMRGVEGGKGPVTVAIIDSGIMVDHPDLKNHLWTGTVGGRQVRGARRIGAMRDDDVIDEDGHGTMLAGTILAAADFAEGVRLMAVKFFDGATLPSAANAADAINFAVEHKADIINLSWDLGIGSERLRQAIRGASAAGKLVVIAAGNNGSDNDSLPSVPSCYAEEPENRDVTITVMATDRYDEKAWFSNFGRQRVDLAAPGWRIVSTRRSLTKVSGDGSRRYRRYSGTSAAAAHVTGAAALLKSRYGDLSAKALKECLVESVDPLPGLKCNSGGRLNLAKALRYAVTIPRP